MRDYNRIEADVDLDSVRYNIEKIKSLNPEDRKVLLVIKADAYGHGAVEFAKEFDDIADYYGVACIDEGVELRNAGIVKPILILGNTDEYDFETAIQNDITMAVYNAEKCNLLSETALKIGKKAKVHIKADSGMSRIGFQCNEEGVEEASKLLTMEGLDIEGIFTHFAKADTVDKKDAIGQRDRFIYFINALTEKGFKFSVKHIDNSAGAMELHSKGFDMMRLGIVIYGLEPSEEMDKSVEIKPAMTLKAHITHIKTLEEGRGISYGWTYVTDKPIRVATVSAGYADGYPRAQSGIGRVIIRGKYAPILGRVCMDQFMVDVSDIPEASLRDEVILFGTDGDKSISVEEVAEPANSFNYELVCNVARRVPRVYFKNGRKVKEINYLLGEVKSH
ncbi:alanine racemase [Eubacterium ruminantium]|uniref:alanine racemase n=1 Tax=Eubacterium ruminantium TaxID=42322 RepID=UPI001567D6BE|nr:alanine racemase [Eubacterium ruminantium]